MTRINRYLIERTKGEKYATVFYGTLDGTGHLQWANAGHCAPLLLHADGRLRTLKTTGLPLGMLEEAEWFVESLDLEPADKIVIYSDGLTEAESPDNQFFGAERLRQLLRERSQEHCEDLHAAILESVERYTEGCVLSDDITLVVVEYQPEVQS
jgi:sigma-B regulation protein RsbU (phosphoserine phosphatase)